MDLQFTLQRYALQLKNQPRTLKRVARVFQREVSARFLGFVEV